MEFDPVHKAQQYNRHPSGIEPKEFCRHLPFGLGNCLKYVWRHQYKDSLRSLESALWYFDDHVQNVPEFGALSPGLVKYLEPLLDQVLKVEPDLLVNHFLVDFWNYLRLPSDKRQDIVRTTILRLIVRQKDQDAAGSTQSQTSVQQP